jgi:hypothetical protein
MIEIINEPFGNFNMVKILYKETAEYLTIVPDYGVCLNELFLKNKEGLQISC